jgi:hypothetical protein
MSPAQLDKGISRTLVRVCANKASCGHTATGFNSCSCDRNAGNPVPDFDLMTVLCHSNEHDEPYALSFTITRMSASTR